MLPLFPLWIILLTFLATYFNGLALVIFHGYGNSHTERYTRKCYTCECWTLNQLSSQGTNSRWTDALSMLPKVSIIVTHYNEEPGRLNKTLSGIFENTPLSLIHQIILVDDHSVTSSLEDVTLQYGSQITIIRNPSREGLIRSRMIGARAVNADVMVFLESHVETTPHWLEPLLARLVHVQKTSLSCNETYRAHHVRTLGCSIDAVRLAVSPVIYDVAERDSTVSVPTEGGFTWNFTYRWDIHSGQSLTETDNQPDFSPWTTPAISGGIFAVWREGFFATGGYDEEMDIWGGENIEFSLRTWMCHGALEIIPCSRIGHHYRRSHPYTFPAGKENTVIRNRKRTALVWLVDNAEDTYEDRPQKLEHLARFYSVSPFAATIPFGDVCSRRRLAKALRCHSFDWYLRNVYPLLKMEALYIKLAPNGLLLAEEEVMRFNCS